MREWADLSDGELRARLNARMPGYPATVDDLVDHRDDETTAAIIDRVLP